MNNELLTYLEKANSMTGFKAAIVGQDPYPHKPSGIPFCKLTFDELFRKEVEGKSKRCCGQDLLCSLGLSENIVRERFNAPTAVFYYLLEHGIVVLNVSYQLLDAPFVKDQTTADFRAKMFAVNDGKIREAYAYNRPIIEKAEKIFLLGKFKTALIFEKYYEGLNEMEILVHPSRYNATGKEKEEWKEVWETKYLLSKIKSS